jgi:peptidyl-prolyl cis-trans isomerase B (cyclophilin B)
MMRFFGQPLRIGLLFAVLALSGCDHHKKPTPADSGSAPVAQTDSVYTGERPVAAASSVPPAYPRALPASLPPESQAPVSTSASKPEVAAESAPTPAPAPMTTPAVATTPPTAGSSDTASSATASTPAPAAASDSTPAPASTSAAAPSSETNPDMTRLAITPPAPVVVTTPPSAWDDADAQKQVVVLETSLGRIVIELDDVSAPRTCGNFRKLVSDGFYDHTTFHRVIPHFMIQGGDPNSKTSDRATYGQGDPGYTLPAEIKLRHVPGAVAMARLPDPANPQRDSNGSQFFICVAACPSLDGQYTVFGHVIAGMDTAMQIANQPRDPRDDPVTRIEMEARLEPKKQALAENPAGP